MITQEKVAHPRNIERIAVIIPAYNVQKYIKECINSVLAQTYQHFTIFVVNDGSTDETGTILSEYQSQDSRIKIFHKENYGASSARNFALSEIKRSKESFTYLFFLDSDDVIEPTFFQKAVSALQQSKADLAVCSVKEFTKNSVRQQPKSHRQILTKDEFAQLHFGIGKLGGTSVSYCFLCNKFFRYSMVIGSLFNAKLKTAEDQEWILSNVMPAIRTAVIVPDAEYCYRLRNSSLCHFNDNPQYFRVYSALDWNSQKYTTSAASCIFNRLIDSMYFEIKQSFISPKYYIATDKLLKQCRVMALGKFKFPIPFNYRKRFLLAFLPRSIIKWHFTRRNRAKCQTINSSTNNHQNDYFD